MDKDRVVKMALASGLEFKLLDDGTIGLRPYIFKLVDMVESAVAHDYEEKRKKDVLALVALRSEVAMLAKDNERLRGLITEAVGVLDKGE